MVSYMLPSISLIFIALIHPDIVMSCCQPVVSLSVGLSATFEKVEGQGWQRLD